MFRFCSRSQAGTIYLTPHHTKDREAAVSDLSDGTGAPEIEITPAMIEAGEEVLLCALGGAVSIYWFPDKLAVSVYEAMKRASQMEEGCK